MASNILTTVYGWPRFGTSEKEMALIKRIHAHVEHISDASIPGRYLVDAFPAMRHLPAWMAKWKREGMAWHEGESRLFSSFTQSVRDRLVCTTHFRIYPASVFQLTVNGGSRKANLRPAL